MSQKNAETNHRIKIRTIGGAFVNLAVSEILEVRPISLYPLLDKYGRHHDFTLILDYHGREYVVTRALHDICREIGWDDVQ